MAKWFTSKKKIGCAVPEHGTVRRVTRNPFAKGDDCVIVGSNPFFGGLGLGHVEGLNSGDVVKVFPDGRILRIWDATSIHNSLFVTSACNYRCDMCPQPPECDCTEQHDENVRVLNLLKSGSVEMIGITGGEPTLYPDRLIEYFEIINERFPSARVEILTNGSPLSDFDVAKRLALTAPLDVCYCVSLHGDTAELAEQIMHCKGGWNNALHGMINLAKLKQPIEVRVVVTRRNASYLRDIALFVYRNFPFISHIAFMGQEIVGEARKNFSKIWVEPLSYASSLADAVEYLAAMNMNVSIYNLPLCLLPERVWRYAARSISDWKQTYRGECDSCGMKENCCGFFATSGECVPEGIHALAVKGG